MAALTYTHKLVATTCWCGLAHAIPEELMREASQTGQNVYCPLGHSWVIGDTEIDQLRKERTQLQQRLDRQRQRTEEVIAERDEVQKKLKSVKRRTTNGVCPCCNRSFANVARHMKTKHPEEVKASA